MSTRVGLKAGGALLVAGVTALFGAAIALAPNALAAPNLTISDSTVHAGQTVTLKGSGFPKAKTSLFITICANPPGATNCDTNLAHVKQLEYNGSGSFSTSYTLAVTKFSSAAGTINCAKTQCVVGTTNALNPADRSYNSVAKFTVATSSPKPTPTPTPTKSSSGGSSSTASPAPTSSELPHTGADSSTPILAGAAGAAVLAGLVLIVVGGRRRSTRQH